jgi:hypothetical protein
VNKQTTLYQGLFLIAFALYANERNQAHPILIQKIADTTPVEISLPAEVDSLYQKLKASPLFATPIDGVTLIKGKQDVRVQLKSDELYRNDEIAMEETWLPVLDQVGTLLFQEGEPKCALTFSSNSSVDHDEFSISSQRAEWVLHYLNRKFQFRLDHGQYRVLGIGKDSNLQGKSTPTVAIIISSNH